ncbi:MAG TPA: translocation/assembly module TamB domain-containing protein, partial [Desulfuromonadaceae bacterium]
RFSGSLRLAKGSAYLPGAGVHVTDVGFNALLEKDIIRIDTFRAVSGPGSIEGTALIRLKGWRVSSYSGKITGTRLQVIYLPEVQCLVTPQLTFEGTGERLAVRGEVRVPELLVNGPPVRNAVAPSSDVIIVGAPPPGATAAPLAMDIRIRVILGDRVLVRMEEIDAELGGSMDLKAPNLDTIVSRGEIRVVKGRYKAYGIDLEIVRGRLFYAGVPIGSPALDILALRTVGDVQAGVTVGGTPRAPLVKLYSKPVMPDVDTLAYIVLGHPLGTGGEQAGLLAQAAGFLLSSSQSVNLKDQIKNRLGLSTLEIGAVGTTPEHMGYTAIPSTPPGTAPTQAALGVSQTMLTVGKYLTPKLYLSFGRSIFTGGNLVRLRYDVSRRWQVETETGTESGADIYYKIDFR